MQHKLASLYEKIHNHDVITHPGDVTLAQSAILSVIYSELAKHALRKIDDSELAAAYDTLIGDW